MTSFRSKSALHPSPGRFAAQRRDKSQGIALALASSGANQVGAAGGALAFPDLGPVGVVAVRQMVTAAVLIPLVRPRFSWLRRRQWALVIGLAVVFSVMNLALYVAIERIGLGLSVSLELLGPLAVAVFGSRRLIELCCALTAGVGVVVLTAPGPSTDVVGILSALLAAAAWAAYILLNRGIGSQLPGLEGTATASAVAAALWLPVATVWFMAHPPTLPALLLAVLCGLLSSVVPYVCDLWALRRVSSQMFGTLASANPVWAVGMGWLLLGQQLTPNQLLGVGLIATSSAAISLFGMRVRS